jgi:PAS domain S-box-containing protein/diguanylate cyclase (GGDEF)-like protein
LGNLNEYIEEHRLSHCTGVIQIFSGTGLEPTVKVQIELKCQLEHFILIGTSTAGEIFHGDCLEQSIIVSFIVFEKNVKAESFTLSLTSNHSIKNTLRKLIQVRPKVIIFFTNALEISPENVLKALHKEIPDCIFAGGNAADNGRFVNTYTLLETEVYRNELVGVALYGDSLQALQSSYTGWQPIGQTFTVTEAENNTLYSLDNKPIMDIYKKYLGDQIVSGLPNTAMEFPFMIRQGNNVILRSPVGVSKNGKGIILAGNIKIGEKVTFSFADTQTLIDEVKQLTKINNTAVIIYSCAARKAYLKNSMKLEIIKLSTLNNAPGGFFYGEYSSSNKQFELLNLSTTLLFLTEAELPIKPVFDNTLNALSIPNSLHTLAHLANTTGKELNDTLMFLEQHQYAVNYSSIVSITDADGIIVYVNKRFEDISGYSSNELIGQTHQLIKHSATPVKVFHSLWQTIKNNRSWQGLILNKKKDGSSYYVKTVIVPILNETGEIIRYLSIRNDVTDIINARQTIKAQNIDLLTGLPNRTKLSNDVKRKKIELLAVFDVRNFKLINDFWGMEIGDNVIQQLGILFTEYAKPYKFQIYKLNGAAFAIRCFNCISPDEFTSQCNEFKEQIESSVIEVNDHPIDISLSIGIGVSKIRVIAIAESALFDAKTDYCSQVVLKTEQELSTNQAYECIEEVRSAINENRLVAHYQRLEPIKNNESHRNKFEALVRIDKGNGQFMLPGVFLENIKKTRLYGALTRKILSIAITTAHSFDYIISVNLSIQDILDKKTNGFIIEKMKVHTGNGIIFEITESEAIKDFLSVTDFIKQVRSFGAKIAIDDFGSGYSNFSYLVDIKPDYIKIDGSIIKGIVNNKRSKQVTKSIIDMARSLGIKTIAEFVSDIEIYECLKELGVDMVQGYYISKPLPLSEI